MFRKHETLKKLDTVLVTSKEFDNVLVWNEVFIKENMRYNFNQKKFKSLAIKTREPPAKKEDENTKTAA